MHLGALARVWISFEIDGRMRSEVGVYAMRWAVVEGRSGQGCAWAEGSGGGKSGGLVGRSLQADGQGRGMGRKAMWTFFLGIEKEAQASSTSRLL